MTDDRPPICDYEGSTYQQEFWEQGGRTYEDRAEAIALKRLLPAHGKLLLELGAGAGRNTNRYTNFERIVLLDYSLTQLQQAQNRLGRSSRYIYVAADIYRMPFVNGLFDAATMIRVLHHMANAPLALSQIRQVLRPNACFILEFANKKNLKAVLRYIFKRQTWNPFSPESVEFAPLNFDFHPNTVRGWLRDLDFRIERQLTVSHFRIGIAKRLVPLELLLGLESLAQQTGDWWQFAPSVFVKARAGAGISARPEQFFRCADCGYIEMETRPEGLHCPACDRLWYIRDGIYDFRERNERSRHSQNGAG